MNGLSGAQIMPSIRWSLVKLPTREMPWMLPTELAGPSQLQAPYKVKPQAQNLGLQGLKERWDRKMVFIYGIPQI